MTTLPERERTPYVSATGRLGWTAGYDWAVAMTMREARFRRALLEEVVAQLPSHGAALDVGAGTGTFAISLARARPDCSIVAVDGDEEAIGLAKEKLGAGAVEWRRALADAVPLPDDSLDAVVMSLLLHHLDRAGKVAALLEAARVLRPGGRLHVADWGAPGDPLMQVAFLGLRLLDGFPNTRDHAGGRLPTLIVATGFKTPTRHLRLRTAWGRLELLEAVRP